MTPEQRTARARTAAAARWIGQDAARRELLAQIDLADAADDIAGQLLNSAAWADAHPLARPLLVRWLVQEMQERLAMATRLSEEIKSDLRLAE